MVWCVMKIVSVKKDAKDHFWPICHSEEISNTAQGASTQKYFSNRYALFLDAIR
jgi:hypothetical protein